MSEDNVESSEWTSSSFFDGEKFIDSWNHDFMQGWGKRKPQLGLKPKRLCDCERLRDIMAAIDRYVSCRKTIPSEWVDEFNQLVKYLNQKESL